jgi:hypothetical protein
MDDRPITGMASAPPETRHRVARLGGQGVRRKLARGRARKWVGREDERDKLIGERAAQQASAGGRVNMAAIAREFGLSRERVRVILARLRDRRASPAA